MRKFRPGAGDGKDEQDEGVRFWDPEGKLKKVTPGRIREKEGKEPSRPIFIRGSMEKPEFFPYGYDQPWLSERTAGLDKLTVPELEVELSKLELLLEGLNRGEAQRKGSFREQLLLAERISAIKALLATADRIKPMAAESKVADTSSVVEQVFEHPEVIEQEPILVELIRKHVIQDLKELSQKELDMEATAMVQEIRALGLRKKIEPRLEQAYEWVLAEKENRLKANRLEGDDFTPPVDATERFVIPAAYLSNPDLALYPAALVRESDQAELEGLRDHVASQIKDAEEWPDSKKKRAMFAILKRRLEQLESEIQSRLQRLESQKQRRDAKIRAEEEKYWHGPKILYDGREKELTLEEQVAWLASEIRHASTRMLKTKAQVEPRERYISQLKKALIRKQEELVVTKRYVGEPNGEPAAEPAGEAGEVARPAAIDWRADLSDEIERGTINLPSAQELEGSTPDQLNGIVTKVLPSIRRRLTRDHQEDPAELRRKLDAVTAYEEQVLAPVLQVVQDRANQAKSKPATEARAENDATPVTEKPTPASRGRGRPRKEVQAEDQSTVRLRQKLADLNTEIETRERQKAELVERQKRLTAAFDNLKELRDFIDTIELGQGEPTEKETQAVDQLVRKAFAALNSLVLVEYTSLDYRKKIEKGKKEILKLRLEPGKLIDVDFVKMEARAENGDLLDTLFVSADGQLGLNRPKQKPIREVEAMRIILGDLRAIALNFRDLVGSERVQVRRELGYLGDKVLAPLYAARDKFIGMLATRRPEQAAAGEKGKSGRPGKREGRKEVPPRSAQAVPAETPPAPEARASGNETDAEKIRKSFASLFAVAARRAGGVGKTFSIQGPQGVISGEMLDMHSISVARKTPEGQEVEKGIITNDGHFIPSK